MPTLKKIFLPLLLIVVALLGYQLLTPKFFAASVVLEVTRPAANSSLDKENERNHAQAKIQKHSSDLTPYRNREESVKNARFILYSAQTEYENMDARSRQQMQRITIIQRAAPR